MAYPKHSRFVYSNYDDIFNAINTGELNQFDICIAQDTRELLLVKEDLDVLPIKPKIYRFNGIIEAETQLNANNDTYEGQLVAILRDGKYVAYIVNRRNNRFVIDSLATVEAVVDYDEITHPPIINMYGELGNPIVLSELADGVYRINGQYKISETLTTIFSSASNNLFVVEKKDEEVVIKKISSSEIVDYHVDLDGMVSVVRYATTKYLQDNNYTTTDYVDAKIAALNFITQEEVNQYVAGIVHDTIDAILDERVDAAIERHMEIATEADIHEIFT